MSARQFSSKAIFKKVFIPAWTLEDIGKRSLKYAGNPRIYAQAQDAEERRQGEASQREGTH